MKFSLPYPKVEVVPQYLCDYPRASPEQERRIKRAGMMTTFWFWMFVAAMGVLLWLTLSSDRLRPLYLGVLAIGVGATGPLSLFLRNRYYRCPACGKKLTTTPVMHCAGCQVRFER